MGYPHEYIGGGREYKGTRSYARIEQSAPGEMRISAGTPEKAVLFISEIDCPGWEMEVNGIERQYVSYANYVFRAVPLEAGEYDIRFFYSPFSVKAGFAVSAAMLFAAALILLLKLRNSGREAGEAAQDNKGKSPRDRM